MALEIIGREHELGTLRAFLDASRRRASALLIRVEAGMGKTTLWTNAVETERAAGARILTCSPAPAERQLAFAAAG